MQIPDINSLLPALTYLKCENILAPELFGRAARQSIKLRTCTVNKIDGELWIEVEPEDARFAYAMGREVVTVREPDYALRCTEAGELVFDHVGVNRLFLDIGSIQPSEPQKRASRTGETKQGSHWPKKRKKIITVAGKVFRQDPKKYLRKNSLNAQKLAQEVHCKRVNLEIPNGVGYTYQAILSTIRKNKQLIHQP